MKQQGEHGGIKPRLLFGILLHLLSTLQTSQGFALVEPPLSSCRRNSIETRSQQQQQQSWQQRSNKNKSMQLAAFLPPDAASDILSALLPTMLSFRDTAVHVAQNAGNIMVPPNVPFVTNHIIHPLSEALGQYQALLTEYPITTKSITAGTLGCAGDAIAQYKSSLKQEQEQEESDNDASSSSSSLSTFFFSEQYDLKRGLAFLTFGALYTGLFQHFWFSTLNTNIMDWGEDFHIWGHPASKSIAIDWWYTYKKDDWWEFFDVVNQIDDVMAGLPDPPSAATLAAAKVALNQFVVIPIVYMPLFFAITGAVAGMDIDKSIARAQSLYIPLLQRNYLFWLPMQFLQFLVLPPEWQIPCLSVASLCWTVILSSIGGSMSQPSSTNVAYETETAPAMAAVASATTSIVDDMVPVMATTYNDMTNPQNTSIMDIESWEEQTEDEEVEVVRVIPNEAGPINEITDGVRLEDVRKAFVPDEVVDAVSDPTIRSTVGGLALGVLAGAADDAVIGAAIGDAIGGLGITPGIAVTSAVGAAVAAYSSLTTSSEEEEEEEEQKDLEDGTIEEIEASVVEDIQSDDVDTQTSDDFEVVSEGDTDSGVTCGDLFPAEAANQTSSESETILNV